MCEKKKKEDKIVIVHEDRRRSVRLGLLDTPVYAHNIRKQGQIKQIAAHSSSHSHQNKVFVYMYNYDIKVIIFPLFSLQSIFLIFIYVYNRHLKANQPILEVIEQ